MISWMIFGVTEFSLYPQKPQFHLSFLISKYATGCALANHPLYIKCLANAVRNSLF